MSRSFLPALPMLGLMLSASLIPVARAATSPDCHCDTAEEQASPWSGRGELGFAATRGNSSTDSLNGRLHVGYAEGEWIHGLDLSGLRASAKVSLEDEDGNLAQQRKTTANRYTLGANSALKLGEYRQFTTALRYERDDFASYSEQQTASVGYGTRIMDGERTQLDLQIGPGVRRAQNVEQDRTESGLIGRGFIGLKFDLTGNTELENTLLVESGTYNTFAQNDLGVSVAMNEHLALKAGLQARHNSEVNTDQKKTDTLTTMNVVYRFK